MMAAVHYPYITTPLFVAQKRFDMNQCGAVLGLNWWPNPKDNVTHALVAKHYVRYFGTQTVNDIATTIHNGAKNLIDGLFMLFCYAHGWNFCQQR